MYDDCTAADLKANSTLLSANRRVKWALGSNLWNYFPRVPFMEIPDVMRDNGFSGLRVAQFHKSSRHITSQLLRSRKRLPARVPYHDFI